MRSTDAQHSIGAAELGVRLFLNMLANLDNNTLESLLAGLDDLSSESVVNPDTFLEILKNKGVSEPIALEILTSFQEGRFDLQTLKSAINFALSQKLASYQNICIVGAIISGLVTLGTFLMTTIGMYIYCGGAVFFCIAAAVKFSREKKQYSGDQESFDIVQKNVSTSPHILSPDQY
jgi:hypothetical protein